MVQYLVLLTADRTDSVLGLEEDDALLQLIRWLLKSQTKSLIDNLKKIDDYENTILLEVAPST